MTEHQSLKGIDVFAVLHQMVKRKDNEKSLKWYVSNLVKEGRASMVFSASQFAPTQQNAPAPKLLHGSDCKDEKGKLLREVILVAKNFRTSPPGFNAPLIMDIEPQFGTEALALNKTNIRALGALCQEDFGTDDLEKLVGCGIVFQIVNDRNPKSNQDVPTLRVASSGLISKKDIKSTKGKK